MHGPPAQDVTALLLAWRDGDADALERLLPPAYEESEVPWQNRGSLPLCAPREGAREPRS